MDARPSLLQTWAQSIGNAAAQGALTGKPVQISRLETVTGPRAGAVLVHAGLDCGGLLQALNRNDQAMLRQFVPWQFPGDPQAYMAGRALRLEAAWPADMAETMIRLRDLGRHPDGAGRWIVGRDELGRTVIGNLDNCPHWLLAGQTGSGKSVAMRGAVMQLAREGANRIVLCDGKQGEGLAGLSRMAIGPVAKDGTSIRSALGWAVTEMRHRYESLSEGHAPTDRIAVVFDEFQEFAGDRAIAAMLSKLAAQGRAAGVHLLAATQHPAVDSFGDKATRRNLPGALALRVADPDASRVAVGGSTPRADKLMGRGDAYAVSPGACWRLQVAYVDGADFDAEPGREPEFVEWPEYCPEDFGQEPGPGRPPVQFSAAEIAVALVSAAHGEGRPALKSRLQDARLDVPGTDRLRELLSHARAIREQLDVMEYEIAEVGDS